MGLQGSCRLGSIMLAALPQVKRCLPFLCFLRVPCGRCFSVTSIKYTPQGAHVATATGLQLSADAVIVTVPIGVLKAGTIDFQPPLPAPKRAAISGIGAGIENKVVLLFEEVFWPGVEFLGLVGPTSYDCGYFLNLHRATGNKILVFMPAGQMALDMEKLSDEATVEFALGQLRRILPNAPMPVRTLTSLYSTVQCSTAQPQNSTAQYSAIQYSTHACDDNVQITRASA